MNCHEEKLKNCYDCCFQLVLEHNIRSVVCSKSVGMSLVLTSV